MGWPPQTGEALPRAGKAWCAEEKWAEWIVAEHGHGPEWSRVFGIGEENWEAAWGALREAVRAAAIETVREVEGGGVSCGVRVEMTIEGRNAAVISAWHYADEGAAPRLVTAYPRPYNRSHGNGA
jgi:Domain of unknown function (DUF6883)